MTVKPWPHSPGIIARIEGYGEIEYEARIFGKVYRSSTHEGAVAWCLQEKRIASWYEEQLAARKPVALFPHFYSLADEMAI